MKAFLKLSIIVLICIYTLSSCASLISLKTPVVQQFDSLEQYKYVYITPTIGVSSSSSGVYGNRYGVYGASTTKSINPSDLISGILLKKGYVRIPHLNTELLDETLIINFGESGRRNLALGGYTIEVTIQFVSAQTNTPIFICTAEGVGSTEADDIRIAINRALEQLPSKL